MLPAGVVPAVPLYHTILFGRVNRLLGDFGRIPGIIFGPENIVPKLPPEVFKVQRRRQCLTPVGCRDDGPAIVAKDVLPPAAPENLQGWLIPSQHHLPPSGCLACSAASIAALAAAICLLVNWQPCFSFVRYAG